MEYYRERILLSTFQYLHKLQLLFYKSTYLLFNVVFLFHNYEIMKYYMNDNVDDRLRMYL